MIGVVLETLQQERRQFDQERGKGEFGEMQLIRENTRAIEQQLERIEHLLKQR